MEENLKSRHLHWKLISRNLPENDPEKISICSISVIAFDESSAKELAKSIIIRDEFIVTDVIECFMVHNIDNSLKNFAKEVKE